LTVNAITVTWATVLDAAHSSALMRGLGATPQQLSAGLATSQIIPALVGGVIGIPTGIGLFAAVPAWIGARRPVARILQSELA
jgi:putative ABC transport system permease protein